MKRASIPQSLQPNLGTAEPRGAPEYRSVKAISITQPIATLAAHSELVAMPCEFRTDYRGKLAIHASQRVCDAAWRLCFESEIMAALARALVLHPSKLTRQAFIAIVELKDVKLMSRTLVEELPEIDALVASNLQSKFLWYIEAPKRLSEPIFMSGELGLWMASLPYPLEFLE